MLEISDVAAAQLHQSLTTAPDVRKAGKCFRIMPKDEKSLTLKVAKPAASDSTFEHEGTVILALPKSLQPFLQDKRLELDSGGQLMFC